MNIDKRKVAKVQEALGWLKQVEVFHKARRFEVSDDCIKKAKAALADPCFDRQPIPGYARGSEQPETVKVVARHLPQGFMIIDSQDFDPMVHELYDEPSTPIERKRSKSAS